MFTSGVIGAAVYDRKKRDWVQAETLLTLCELYRLDRQPKRKLAFLRQLDWIGRWQVDWANGSWHGLIDPSGQPVGKKARHVEQPVPHRPRGAGLPTRARRHRGGRRQRWVHADLMGGTIAVFGSPPPKGRRP